ncbi:hypothetical protein FOA52_001868 [Chlamydomonas sp. UWO 241]|nr:hypothetical protein FOA52_001868 [Chlamydomonas sp. UWO 241]
MRCCSGTLLSYAKDSHSASASQRSADFNAFVIFDVRNVLACHDYEYIDLLPDPFNASCHAAYGGGPTATVAERDGKWRHIAVTWSAAHDGLTRIYVDGLLMAQAVTKKTAPLPPGGSLMLGGEQDCYAGCTDPGQGFNGMLDEVRIWRVVRTQTQILDGMRRVSGLETEADLVAYWKFDDADVDEGQFRLHTSARDSSRYGNHLALQHPPTPRKVVIEPPLMPGSGSSVSPPLDTSSLQFRNNHGVCDPTRAMPQGSFTIELWARGAELRAGEDGVDRQETLLSYATQKLDSVTREAIGFIDDAIRLERLQADLSVPLLEPFWETSTLGALRLHVNSEGHGDADPLHSASGGEAWVDFHAQWTGADWVHIAVSWDVNTGEARAHVNGVAATAFWVTQGARTMQIPPDQGGVEPYLSAGSVRSAVGSLVLGQDQDCWGGCFRASHAFRGELAVVRVWDRVLSREEIVSNIGREHPTDARDLAALYTFGGMDPAQLPGHGGDGGEREGTVADGSGLEQTLVLRSSAPQLVYSTAPLAMSDGRPVKPPTPGAGGYSLALSDRQVLLASEFSDFPSTALTLEFWMWSVDGCRAGVPFSYAVGDYRAFDNAFLLFNYNSWGVAVMEDEGTLADHLSGVSATDGSWHHIAVTWESRTGRVVLYDHGRVVWRVTRAKGMSIPSGGTLVVGREQDCEGGCFDSAQGASGPLDGGGAEYGAQDFTGAIDEMRLWRVARTAAEIRDGLAADNGRGPGGFASPGLDPAHPDLVAYWHFDEGPGGHQVRDHTGHGHHLAITQSPPEWIVTRWLSSCGNGILEGMEQCDDGGRGPGTGHAAAPGGGRAKAGGGGGVPSWAPPPGRPPSGGSSAGSSGGGGGGSIAYAVFVWLIVLGVAAGVGTMAVMQRRALAEAASELREHLYAAADRMGVHLPGYTAAGSLSAVDPEMTRLLAPDFIAASPPSRAPGHPGAYTSLPSQPPYAARPGAPPAGP